MFKAKKNRAVSVITVIALVITMLPLGALTAFAGYTTNAISNTQYQGSTSVSVVRGLGTSQAQTTGNIDLKEDTDNDASWDSGRAFTVVLPTGVTFAEDPIVTLNGIVKSSSLEDSTTLACTLTGTSGHDALQISNIKVYITSSATGTALNTTVKDPDASGANMTIQIAKMKEGVKVTAALAGSTAISIGENGQSLAPMTFTESATGTLEDNDTFSMTCPDGLTFYEQPVISESSEFALDDNAGALSDSNKTATWKVATISSTTGPVTMTVTPKVNVASTVTSGIDVKVTFSISNSDIAIAPSPLKVAESESGDDISIKAGSTPSISKAANQAVGDIIITENAKELIDDTTLTVTLGNSIKFASTPKATPTGGIQIEDPSEDGQTTAQPAKINSDHNTATWQVAEKSTGSGGTITISGIVVNAEDATGTSVVSVTLSGAAGSKVLTIANINTTSNVSCVASGAPAIKIGTAGQAGGDITITESKAAALTRGTDCLNLKIFGVTSDKEVQFSELPTFDVTSGSLSLSNIEFINTPATNGYIEISADVTSTGTSKASVIKISGIKYDVNSKATEGSVQVVITNSGTRLASVTNANISKTGSTFSDVASNHWAKTYIDYLATKGIIGGYTDGTFKPEGVISRAEFAKIAVIAGGYTLSTTSTTSSFSDVASSHWAIKYIETAKNQGIIGGYADGTFKPDAKITRAELAKIVVGAGKFTINKTGTAFPDVAADHWAYDYIMTAKNLSIIGGYPDGTFGPAKNATRAEASKMVYEWLN